MQIVPRKINIHFPLQDYLGFAWTFARSWSVYFRIRRSATRLPRLYNPCDSTAPKVKPGSFVQRAYECWENFSFRMFQSHPALNVTRFQSLPLDARLKEGDDWPKKGDIKSAIRIPFSCIRKSSNRDRNLPCFWLTNTPCPYLLVNQRPPTTPFWSTKAPVPPIVANQKSLCLLLWSTRDS